MFEKNNLYNQTVADNFQSQVSVSALDKLRDVLVKITVLPILCQMAKSWHLIV